MKSAMLVTSMANVGGTEVATSIQARALVDHGWRVVVVGEPGPLTADFEKDGIEMIPAQLYSKNPFVILRTVFKCVAAVRRSRPDVVHCQMARPVPLVWAALWLTRRTKRTKLFWTSRGLNAESYPRVVKTMMRLGVRALGNCRGEAEKLQRYGMAPHRTSYVYNAYRLSPTDRRAARPAEPPLVIGTLAALRADRRIDHFLLMAQQVLAQSPEGRPIEFRVAGDGPHRPALEQQAKDLGLADHITFVGSQSDVTGFLAQLHVMVSTAHSDKPDWGAGLSNAIIEAMVVGVPVVSYAAAGIPEIVIEGSTGYLAPAGDLTALTDAVMAATTDVPEAEARADAAYANILVQCDPKAVSDRLLQIYRDL